jgi:hypothetical protein
MTRSFFIIEAKVQHRCFRPFTQSEVSIYLATFSSFGSARFSATATQYKSQQHAEHRQRLVLAYLVLLHVVGSKLRVNNPIQSLDYCIDRKKPSSCMRH